MSWEDAVADAIVQVCGGNPIILFMGILFFAAIVVLTSLAIFIGKNTCNNSKQQGEMLELILNPILIQQDKSTTLLVESQNKMTKEIVASQNQMVEAIISRLDETKDDLQKELARQENHLVCIKGIAIETNTAVKLNGRH